LRFRWGLRRRFFLRLCLFLLLLAFSAWALLRLGRRSCLLLLGRRLLGRGRGGLFGRSRLLGGGRLGLLLALPAGLLGFCRGFLRRGFRFGGSGLGLRRLLGGGRLLLLLLSLTALPPAFRGIVLAGRCSTFTLIVAAP